MSLSFGLETISILEPRISFINFWYSFIGLSLSLYPSTFNNLIIADKILVASGFCLKSLGKSL